MYENLFITTACDEFSDLLSVDTSMNNFSNSKSDSEIVAVKMLKGMLLIYCVRFNGNYMFKVPPYINRFIFIDKCKLQHQKVCSKRIKLKLCIE